MFLKFFTLALASQPHSRTTNAPASTIILVLAMSVVISGCASLRIDQLIILAFRVTSRSLFMIYLAVPLWALYLQALTSFCLCYRCYRRLKLTY